MLTTVSATAGVVWCVGMVVTLIVIVVMAYRIPAKAMHYTFYGNRNQASCLLGLFFLILLIWPLTLWSLAFPPRDHHG